MAKPAALFTPDRIAALLLACVFAGYGYAAGRIPTALEADVVCPGFFPRIVAVVGFMLALALLLQPAGERSGRLFVFDRVALAPAGLLLVYALTLEIVGFLTATLVFLAVAFKYLGCPGWARSVLYSVIGTAAIIALFRYGLELKLPAGELVRY